MIVSPKIRTPIKLIDGEIRDQPPIWEDLPSSAGDGLYLRCVGVHPKSSKGKNVTVHIPPEDVAAALRMLKEFAIRQRKVTLSGKT